MKQHALSEAFPSMPEDELASLVEDIKANGLREPGVIFEGKILDGWHRYQACEKAGIPFRSFPLGAGKDPVTLVISRNAHRRHLSAGQKAAAILRCAEWRSRGGNQSAPGALRGATDAELAKVAGVSERTIEQVKAGIRAGLKDEIKEGKVSAKKAAEIAKLPERERKAAVKNPPPKEKKPSPLEQDNARLREELEQTRENLPELTAMAAAAEAFKDDDQFKKILHLETELSAVKKRRDELMRENVALKQQNKYLQSQLKKLQTVAKAA
jgi:hypothetical protein